MMNCTPDPQDYYRLSRVVVMPSVVPETFGLVAAVVRLWDEPEVVAAYRRRVGRWPRPGSRAGRVAVRGDL